MFGLFESETVVSVSTSVSRVIEDRLLPNSVKTGTIKGLLSNEGNQLVENIMEDMVSSMGVKAEKMYRYGKNGYIYGRPTSKIHKSGSILTIAGAVIQDIVGHPTEFAYVQYAPLNRLHYGWQRIYDTYGYDPQSNELTVLSAAKGSPVYLEDMQVMFPQVMMPSLSSTAFEQWGISPKAGYTPIRPYSLGASVGHSPIGVDAAATESYVHVTYVWMAGGVLQRESLNIPMLVGKEQSAFVQARYTYKVESHRTIEPDPRGIMFPSIEVIHYNYFTQFFTYEVGSGTHPDLDVVFTTEFNDLGSFFPFGYFRFNKTTSSTDPNTAEFKSLNKLLKCLNLDYTQINEAVNANPQIEHVESALLMMIVPAQSSNAMENRYLFDFFKRLYLQTELVEDPSATENPTSSLVSQILSEITNTVPSKINLTIRDARFGTSLGMTGIYRKIIPGSIGKVGTYTSATAMGTRKHKTTLHLIDPDTGQPITNDVSWTTTEPSHYYRKQITSTLYEEIQVTSLRMTYEVSGSHVTTNQMVPLDHSITQDYSLPDREELYARSLHYVINSKQETELEWYQQEWFSTVIIIVAVVWTAVSMGSDGGSGLGAAMAAGTATLADIAVAVLIAAAWYVGIKVVTKLFVKMFGAEFALLFAVVVAAYGMYTQFRPGGLKGAPWAEQLLPLSNSLMTEASGSYAKDLQLLGEEADAFGLMAKAKTDELKKIQEELEGSRLLSPFVLFGEKPEEYFNRTVHSGNIGINSIDAISNYCDISLKLPTLEQTLSLEEV